MSVGRGRTSQKREKRGNSSARLGHAVDRQAAAGHAVLVAGIGRAEIGGAEEDGDVLREVGVEMQPPAGEAEIVRQGRVEPGRPVVEQAGVVLDRPRLAIVDDEDPHRRLVVEAEMEELDPERQVGVGPQRVVGAKAQGLVLVPGQLGELLRPLVARHLERLPGELARLRLQPLPVERLGGAEGRLRHQVACTAEHAAKQGPSGEGRGAVHKVASVHAALNVSLCHSSVGRQRTTRFAGGKCPSGHRPRPGRGGGPKRRLNSTQVYGVTSCDELAYRHMP